MNKPSIKTLESAFPGKGRILRKLLTCDKSVLAHPAVIRLREQCCHRPSMAHMRMTALDAELETCGVEYIPKGRNQRSPAFDYCNTGDSYGITIVRFSDGRYRVSSWGDIVERGNYE